MLLPSATKLRRSCFYTCLSVRGGGSASVHAGILPPQEHTSPSRWLLLRTVRILLECILVRNFISANKIKYLAKFISVILNAHICSFFPRGILPSSFDRNWSTSSSTTLMLALSPVAPKLVKLVVLAFLLPPKLLRLAVLAGLVDKMPPESPVSIAVAEEPPAPAVKYIWSPCLSKIRERTQLTFNKILLQ